MKKIVKRITAAVLAAATTMALCITASAATATGTFYATKQKAIEYKLTVSTDSAGGYYYLTSKAAGTNSTPYAYANLYVQANLYGTNGGISSKDNTVNNISSALVTVSRSTSTCKGVGYGYFRGYGVDEYGEVYGVVSIG